MQTKKAIDKVAPLLSEVERLLGMWITECNRDGDIARQIKNNLDEIRIDLAKHDEEILHVDDLVALSYNRGVKFSELLKEYKPIVTSDTLYRKIK